jgi:hypothetical protein
LHFDLQAHEATSDDLQTHESQADVSPALFLQPLDSQPDESQITEGQAALSQHEVDGIGVTLTGCGVAVSIGVAASCAVANVAMRTTAQAETVRSMDSIPFAEKAQRSQERKGREG